MSEEEFFKSRYIEHVVKPTDTLQGIAIQYGIKVLNEFNKTWLFMHKHFFSKLIINIIIIG